MAAGLSIVYRFVCVWENKKRDKAGTAEAFEHAYEDDLTDKTVCWPNFVSCRRRHPLMLLPEPSVQVYPVKTRSGVEIWKGSEPRYVRGQ